MSRETKELMEVATTVPLLSSEMGTKKINDFTNKLGMECEKVMDMLDAFTQETILKIEKTRKESNHGEIWNERIDNELFCFYTGMIERFCSFLLSMVDDEEARNTIAEDALAWAKEDIETEQKNKDGEE